MKKIYLFYRKTIVFYEESTLLMFLLFFTFLIVSHLESYGQGNGIKAPVQLDVFPPAPNAASLGKFADLPVSLYTGTPNIDIPIWEVKEGDIKLPVSLSYNARGIQVQETAPWVGIGWVLNSGGVITRSVRGSADDMPNGFLDASNIIPTWFDPTNQIAAERFFRYAAGFLDSQPDLFTFNFGNRSGKFQLDQSHNCYITPFQKLKIEHSSNTGGPIVQWLITAEDGTKYKFDIKEKTRSQSYCDVGGQSVPENSYTTSWYLSSITSPKGATVNFIYETGFSLYYPIGRFEHDYTPLAINGTQQKPDSKCVSFNDVKEGVRLKKITYSGGEIEFISGGNRADLPNDKMLQNILIKDHNGNIVRNFKLNYQYMYENSLVTDAQAGYVAADATKYRLTLISVQETDPSSNIKKPSFEFYYNLGLPDRLSYAIDHWGFYNGKTENTTLVPLEEYDNGVLPGAAREPYLEHAIKGTLNKIVNPLGGSTTFTFELHKADRGMPEALPKQAKLLAKDSSGLAAKVEVKEPFTINNVGKSGAYVKINLSNIPCDTNFSACGIALEIAKNVNGTPGEVLFSSLPIPSRGEIYFFLPNGNYFLKNRFTGNYVEGATYRYYEFSIKWNEFTGNQNYSIGGLRVSKIVDYDPATGKNLTKTIKYLLPDNSSSGKVTNLPFYGYAYLEDYTENDWYFYGSYYVRSSSPNIPMGLTQGSQVGYSLVTEYHGEWNNNGVTDIGYNGKTEYFYTTPYTHPDKDVSNRYPFSPVDSRDWMRGALLKKIDYKRDGQNYVPVKKLENEYAFYDESNSNINIQNCIGLKVAFFRRFTSALDGVFDYKYFNFYTGYKELIKTIETTYDQNDITKFTTTETRFEYSPVHLEVSKKLSKLSSGKTLTEYTTYPLDYASSSGAQFIEDLKTANIINAPIETVKYIYDGVETNFKILSGHVNTYKTGGKGLLNDVSYLETIDPISGSNFKFSNRQNNGILPPSGSAYNFSPSSLYKPRFSFSAYDNAGNVLSYTKDNQPASILWGYKSNFPVAEIKNAVTSSDITTSSQVAYNGFETGVSAPETGWANVISNNVIDKNTAPANVFAGRYAFKMEKAPAGDSYYGPTFNLNLPSPQKGKYKMSCWVKTPIGMSADRAYLTIYTMKKNTCCGAYPNASSSFASFSIPPTNNTWQYVEVIIDLETIKNSVPNDDLALRCFSSNSSSSYEYYIDEIRISPLDAQMTTYTYDPQIGITSIHEPNAKVTFYEYDTLGRLMNIKNQEGNIMTSHSYSYWKK